LTVLIHEFAHTFEGFLILFFTNGIAILPQAFKPSEKNDPEIGWWMEIKLLGGQVCNGDDGTGRHSKLRVSHTAFSGITCR
jgi:hypothetical protein